MSRKRAPASHLTAQKGVNVVEETVLAMGFHWHPAGAFDSGIDGRIELRDGRTAEPLNKFVGVQSKARTKFTAEDATGFEFLCDQADVDYWMRSHDPVIVVCSHPETREAWFCCVTDWFADAERRAGRRIVFDKRNDRFEAAKASELFRLAARDEPAQARAAPSPPEELITNLLPLVQLTDRIWSAPALVEDHHAVQVRYDLEGGARASDYLLRDKKLYSLRDPNDCALRHLCDAAGASSFPAAHWAESDDPAFVRYWVELLRRALLQQVKHQLQWHPKRHVFYFPAPNPLEEMSIEGAHGSRLVVKVKRYFDKRAQEERLSYVRHQAFRPSFHRDSAIWYLAIEPEYHYTYDGERESARADEYLAGIKLREKNSAVVGHLKMWEYLLTRPPSLLQQEAPLLTFGGLQRVKVPVGIDDRAWRGPERAEAHIPGQEELAA